ncbi:MAG: glycosyltransferase family 2 protein [Bacteroidaceae bacterium]|nr:glycosyltransferase family 2 protein [Bacteroidaceae bacterium]
MDLSIIIVNYNVRAYLEQCLRSVFASRCVLDFEVYVVDNHSTDGSVAYLKGLYPQVHFIENDENLGFARANNEAIRCSQGRYVLLLNPDTIITEHTLVDCVSYLDTRPDAGGLGTYMLRTDGSFAYESRRGLPTPFVAFCKMSGLCKMFPHSRLFGKYYMRYLNEMEESEIEVISGAFMMLRRSALENVGLLDEAFFMYGEDIDLSYRLLKGGFKNYYIPSPILHYKGESTEKSSFRYVYTFYNAMQLFFNKHYKRYKLLIWLPISMAIWIQSGATYLRNQFRHNKKTEKSIVYTCAVVAPAESQPKIRALLEKAYPGLPHVFIEGTEETLPQGHLGYMESLGNVNMVVYDVDSYSFGTMLDNLASTPEHTLRLGTYSSRTGLVINESSVLS